MSSPTDKSTPTPMDELRLLVRKGRLFEVQSWIAAGKPVFDAASRKQEALETAVEAGFHSMVEVLARVWTDQESLDAAFFRAVNKRRIDLVWLLLEHGADMKSVSLGCIAECSDKELMRFYLDRWDIVGTEDGLTDIATVRAYPLIGLIREYAPRIANHKAQLGAALNYFIKEGSLKWISLAMWMGADPRLPAPYEFSDFADPDEWMTPIEYAALKASVPALKLMKLSPEKDNLNALIGEVSYWRDEGYDVAEYLLSLGANINNKENGGSSIMDHLLRPDVVIDYHGASRGHVSGYRLESWVKRGARWVPESDNYAFREARASIYGLSSYSTLSVLKAMVPATTKENLLKLFNTPKMCKQLEWKPTKLKEEIEKLYRPPVERPTIVKEFVIPAETTFKQIKPHLVEFKQCEISRCDLYERVWAEPGVAVGAALGMSSVGLAKICKAHKIPIPGRGYWAKKHNSHKVRQKPLSSPEWNPAIRICSYRGVEPIGDDELRKQVQKIQDRLSAKELCVEVSREPAELHPLLKDTSDASGNGQSGLYLPDPRGAYRVGNPVEEEKAQEFRERGRRVMNALLLFLEALGFEVGLSSRDGFARRPAVRMFNEEFVFKLDREGMRLRLDLWGCPYSVRSTWRDGKSRYVESFFAEFAATLAYVAALNCSKKLPSPDASS